MVFLGFVVDLPRLTSWSLDDVKKMLLEVAGEYASSSLLEESNDMIALFKITDSDQVTNLGVEYETAGTGYFRFKEFRKAVKNLTKVSIGMGLGSEIGAGDLMNMLDFEPFYTMGTPFTERHIIIITCSLPDMSSSGSILMAAKEKCVSFEFLLVDNQTIAHEKKETFRRIISKFDNCELQYWPANLEIFAKALSKKLYDDSGDLSFILFPLEPNSLYFHNVRHTFEIHIGMDADVDVLSVYKITSHAVQSRFDSFLLAENFNARLIWFLPANMGEVHSIAINGFGSHKGSFGEIEPLLRRAQLAPDGECHVMACSRNVIYNMDEDEEPKEHISPVYLIGCKVRYIQSIR